MISFISEPRAAAWGAGPQAGAWGAGAPAGFAGGLVGNMTVADKVPPDMIHMVDAHWYQFPPMNPLWHALLGFAIGVLGIFFTTIILKVYLQCYRHMISGSCCICISLL